MLGIMLNCPSFTSQQRNLPMLSSDQEARIRFAYRVWSTGNTYGAPAAAVRAAHDLIDQLALEGAPTSQEAFTKLAKEILRKSEN
tara:strand:+ start:282 stop:536 length:255 start_codon:yes stop_codon:yes gene_type:complete